MGKKLYVGNLSYDVDSSALEQLFTAHGTVTSAQIITGPAKDSFNDFNQAENVNIQALAASSCTISGKSLRVTLPSKSVAMLVLTPQ